MRKAGPVVSANPAMAFRMVDLPEPDSPTIPKLSPLAIVNDTLRTAWMGRPLLPKVTERSLTSIIAATLDRG